MKAAVLHQLGQAPHYESFPDPVASHEDQVLITVKAASVKNLDKSRAAGTHYSSHHQLPEVPGVDGVGLLADGTRVYAMGITGMLAEKALIDRHKYTIVPDGIDDATAAALPNAVIGAALALHYRADMTPGQTVLINGATGVTGKLAIQMARHYGAHKIIATGRNPSSLAGLVQLGADEVISLLQEDEAIISQVKAAHRQYHIDIVIDYTWGHPLELIIRSLKGSGLHHIAPPVKVVTAGSMAGEHIQLSSGLLRSSDIVLLGSGFGSLSADVIRKLGTEILPGIMKLAADGLLCIDTDVRPLSEVTTAWDQEGHPGKRLVLIP